MGLNEERASRMLAALQEGINSRGIISPDEVKEMKRLKFNTAEGQKSRFDGYARRSK